MNISDNYIIQLMKMEHITRFMNASNWMTFAECDVLDALSKQKLAKVINL